MSTIAAILRRSAFASLFVALGVGATLWGPRAYQIGRYRWSSHEPTTTPTSQPASNATVDTWTVGRGDLHISFVESGKLRAVKSYPIFAALSRYQLKITFLAPEGSMVKKGDLIASFDKKQFTDQLTSEKTELEGATRQLAVNKAAVDISIATGKASVLTAETKLDEAQVAYKTYIEMEGPKRLNELDKLISEARGKAAESQKAVATAQQQIDDGLFSEEDQKQALERDLATAKENYDTLDKSVTALLLQRKIFRAYEYPQALKSKQQAAEGAKVEVERAKIASDNEVNQKREELAKVDDQIKRLNLAIADMQDSISKCDITAPVDGLVVYGDPANIYYGGPQIKVGADWYGGQTLMTIPDLSAFEIDIGVTESYVGKITVGMPTNVTFEAVPNLTLAGAIKDIAKLGRGREEYDPNSPRVFTTAISLAGSDSRLVSGMTARVEILADSVKNALLVPIDAVATESDKTLVMVRKDGKRTERREVKVGRSNNSMVEIVSGLSEGERIALGTTVGADSPTK